MKCPDCGAIYEDELGACPECGAVLAESASAPGSDPERPEGSDDAQDVVEGQEEDAAPQEVEESQEGEEPPAQDASEPEPDEAPQQPLGSSPEPFVVLTSSAMNGIQQRCPHCGAVVYAGMRRCTRCGKRLAQDEAEEDAGALRAAPLREYKRFIGNKGVVLIILLVLAGGYFVTQLVPRLMEPLINDAPTIIGGGQSIDHEINAYMEEGEQEAEEESEGDSEEAAPALSPENFGVSWHGTYQGTSGSSVVSRPLSLKFNSVEDDGSLQATLVVGEEGSDAAIASYYVVGTIDWQTGAIELRGDEWIDSGELARMRMFVGTVDMEAGSISGTSSELDGSRQGSWSMSLS